MEAKRQYLLLEAVHESALAYQEFITQANAAMQALPDALQALRARATQAQEQAQQDLARSRESLDRYLAEQDKVDDTAPAEVSTGQNLGRSHDADIRRLLEAGTGVIRQGYLMKTARTWGWRRRFFVLDAQGMLTYYNEKARIDIGDASALASRLSVSRAGPLPACQLLCGLPASALRGCCKRSLGSAGQRKRGRGSPT